MKLYDVKYMQRAIELAKRGEGFAHPNPLVGAVIVKDERIIGEGWHKAYGGLHAEREAFKSLIEPADGATLYVTLEPCAHTGKQPPCTEAIIENGISRVVIGSRDPNPLVSGKGAKLLREKGIEVEEDVLLEECDSINDIFFHYITKKTPYILMKYAMSADGKIATETGASKWITGDRARNYVQRLRHRCMGIMVGIETVLCDDPMLNCRREEDRNPIRIILDSKLRIPMDSNIIKTAKDIDTIVVTAYDNTDEGFIEKSSDEKMGAVLEKGVRILNISPVEKRVNIVKMLEILGKEGIDSILLEGGGTLNKSVLDTGMVNEILVFMAPKIFGGDAKTPVMGRGVLTPDEAFKFKIKGSEMIGEDIMICLQAL